MAKFPGRGPTQFSPPMISRIIWIEVGHLLVLLLAGVDKIPQDFFESANWTARTNWQQFRHITVPAAVGRDQHRHGAWSIYAVKIFEFPFSFTGLEPNPASYTVAVYSYILASASGQPIYRLGYASGGGRDAAAGGDLHRPRHSLADAPRNRPVLKEEAYDAA